MKRIKSFLTIIMATIFALSLVPSGAFADGTATSGRQDNDATNTGTITIKGTKANEIYKVYELFKLASFNDAEAVNNGENPTDPNNHDATEAYSYVIRETTDGTNTNPWWNWLTSDTSYAKQIPPSGNTSSPVSGQLFWYELSRVSPDGLSGSDWHVIRAVGTYDAANLNTNDVNGTNYTSTNFLDANHKDVQEFARAALAFAEGRSIAATYTPSSVAADGTDITISNVPLGYYLMGTTSGTLVSLDTSNRDVTIYDKNDEPTIDKKVSKTIDGTYYEDVDADIGDKVYFRTTINAKQGAKDYRLHDVMETGLRYGTEGTGNEEKVYGKIEKVTLKRDTTPYEIEAKVSATTDVDGSPISSEKVNWEAKDATGSDGCDFEVWFASDGKLVAKNGNTRTAIEIKDGDEIVVTYSATVTADAAIFGRGETATGNFSTVKANGDGGDTNTIGTGSGNQVNTDHNADDRNTNSTILTYANKSFTSWADAKVTTYEFDVVKTKDAATGTQFDLLDGAEFKLYRVVETGGSSTKTVNNQSYLVGDALKFGDGTSNKYMYAGNDDGLPVVTGDTTDTLVSTGTAAINVYGLQAGTYVLEETKAPSGYNKLSSPIVIVVRGDADHDGVGTGATLDNDPVGENEGKITTVQIDNNGTVKSLSNASKAKAVIDPSGKYDTAHNDGNNVADQGGIQVINKTGPELPSTGGIGTTIFYVAGTVLVVGAAVMLVAKRRMGSEA